ncbi:MAG: hypothetical protein ACK4RK_09885 [Gemmataceae bacterium]
MTVIAVLQLIFGGMGLVCGICGLGAEAAGGQQMFAGFDKSKGNEQQRFQQEFEKRVEESISAYKTIQLAEKGLGVALSIMMLASGVGLLQMQAWGRQLAIGYASISIALKIFGLIFAVVFVIPVVNETMELMVSRADMEMRDQEMLKTVASFVMVFMVGAIFITMIYPIIVLCFMLSSTVKRAFTLQESGPLSDTYQENWNQDSPRQW